MTAGPFRQHPTSSRERGLAAIGFELTAPSEIELEPIAAGATVVRCRELVGGKLIGELEIAVFGAALVIDRDGILADKVRAAIELAAADPRARVLEAIPVRLPGASGFRADAELVRPMGAPRPPLPFVYVLAIAPHDLGVDGGVLVTVRCATADWPAADRLLRSMRLLSRRRTTANDRDATADDAQLSLPMIGKRDV